MVRHTLKSLGPKVLADRMVRDYVTQLYTPGGAVSSRALERRLRRRASELADVEGSGSARPGPAVRIDHVESSGVGDAPELGDDPRGAGVRVARRAAPDDVDVQVVHGRVRHEDDAGRHRRSTSLGCARDLRGRPAPVRGPVALATTGPVRLHRPGPARQRAPGRAGASCGLRQPWPDRDRAACGRCSVQHAGAATIRRAGRDRCTASPAVDPARRARWSVVGARAPPRRSCDPLVRRAACALPGVGVRR